MVAFFYIGVWMGMEVKGGSRNLSKAGHSSAPKKFLLHSK